VDGLNSELDIQKWLKWCISYYVYWVTIKKYIYIYHLQNHQLSFPGGSVGKESACNVGDLVSIPGLGRSPGEGNGNPIQYSCLKNFMDRGAWRTAQSMGLQRVRHD